MQNQRSWREAKVDTGAVYERIRQQFISLVTSLTHGQLNLRVDAAPEWSVRDVLAHVVGLAADLNAQHFPALDDAGGTTWTNRQVELRRSRSIAEVVSEWNAQAPAFEEGLKTFGYDFGSHFVADLYTHYHDVRSAVRLPPDTDELSVAVALDHYLGFIDEMLTNVAWGTLEVVADRELRQLGTPHEFRARVTASRFELLRAMSARRSARQITALDWQGDVLAFVNLMQTGFVGGYALPVTDLVD